MRFSRDTLAEVFWDSQHSGYCPWWGEAEWTRHDPINDEIYPYPYPLKIWEVGDYLEKIEQFTVTAEDIEAAIIQYAIMHKRRAEELVEDMDLVIADDILQLACFKEIRYS
jgi:hypothetical protein